MTHQKNRSYVWTSFLSIFLLSTVNLCSAYGSTAEWLMSPTQSGLHDDSELGIIVTSGNSNSQSFNVKQANAYGWKHNFLKFNSRYLSSEADGAKTALSWAVGVRYERELSDVFGVFVGQSLDSDVFSGYFQRYNTDIGSRYLIRPDARFHWDVEAGYRFSVQNQINGQLRQSYLRFYTAAVRSWTKTFSTKAGVEVLPNVSNTSDYWINPEIAANAALSEVFALKTSYTLQYHRLPPAGTKSTDTQFTTALVAKF